jgi:metallo-beta-lactamase family protein
VPFGTPTEVGRRARHLAAGRPHPAPRGCASTPRATRGRALFSGDLGRPQHEILPPEPPDAVATCVIESTYGNRRYDDAAALSVSSTRSCVPPRRGAIVIPAFAVDRTEVMLLTLRRLAGGPHPDLLVTSIADGAGGARRYAPRRRRSGDPPEFRRPAPFDPGGLAEAHSADD